MTLDGDIVLFEELADGKAPVDYGYVYRVRVKLLELSEKLVRFIDTPLSEVSVEEGTQSGGHGKIGGCGRALS